MHIILGATGHVGSALSRLLLERGEAIITVSRGGEKLDALQAAGADAARVDVRDVGALRTVFERGERLFLLNPPAAPTTDTDTEERATLRAILTALEDSGLERVVAVSTFGAQAGAHNGDLGVLYEMEQELFRRAIPTSIVRAAYYFSNWDSAQATAAGQGVVHSLYPPHFQLPMVAPRDVAELAARLLTASEHALGVFHVEGPERYSAADVAAAFGAALSRTVEVVEAPRERWVETFRSFGFSPSAAESYACMTASTLDGSFPEPGVTLHGGTSLGQYVTELCRPVSPVAVRDAALWRRGSSPEG